MGRPSGRIPDGLGNFGTRDTQTQGYRCIDRPSGKIPDGLGNFGTRDTQTQGSTWADHPVGSRMVWVTLVHGILRRRGQRGETIREDPGWSR